MGTLSTLELMLKELDQADEEKKDLPPLPVRPITKARLPKGKRKFKQFGQESQLKRKEAFVDPFPDKICLMVDRREGGVVGIQRYFRGYQARRYYHELKTGAVALQSCIRGWLARKQLGDERVREETKVPCSVLLDLQRHILKTEAAIERKKEENAGLKIQIRQYENKWNQYESNMKAMEKMWQQQLTSMQISLAAERKKHSTVGKLGVLMRQDKDEDDGLPGCSQVWRSESSDTSGKKQHVMDIVNHFQNCVEDECKSVDELEKLKLRFEAWKKEYKNKLREVKATMKQRGKIWCGR